jgi:hypothetical protein
MSIFRQTFNFDIQTLDYRQYMRNWMIGVRRHLLKLDDESLPQAKQKFRVLYWLDTFVEAVFYSYLARMFFNCYFADKTS